MDLRDPNHLDMMQIGRFGIGAQIRAIFNEKRSNIKICEMLVNMEAPDADAEIYTAFTNDFTGAARNVDTVTAVADDTNSLREKYFFFYVSTTKHYVWFKVGGTGSDPTAGGTAHEVAFATDANAATVGAAIVAVIDALANISATGTTDMLISCDNVGVVTAAAYDGDSGFTFVNNIAGAAAYTASYFYAVSSSVKDDSVGVGTQTIRVFIIDATGAPNSTDIIMDGTTIVKSSVKATGIYGMIGLTAGSENDSAGDITLLDNKANDVYCTIAAANMGSVSARCWVPDGWKCKMGEIHSHVMEVAHADIDIILDLGAILTPIVLGDGSGVTPDVLEQFVICHLAGDYYKNHLHLTAVGANACYFTLNHVTKAADANTTLYTEIKYILWKEA